MKLISTKPKDKMATRQKSPMKIRKKLTNVTIVLTVD